MGLFSKIFGSYSEKEVKRVMPIVEKINGLERLRISSIEITELDDKFMDVLKSSKILVDHMHIPIQSGSNEILKLPTAIPGFSFLTAL